MKSFKLDYHTSQTYIIFTGEEDDKLAQSLSSSRHVTSQHTQQLPQTLFNDAHNLLP